MRYRKASSRTGASGKAVLPSSTCAPHTTPNPMTQYRCPIDWRQPIRPRRVLELPWVRIGVFYLIAPRWLGSAHGLRYTSKDMADCQARCPIRRPHVAVRWRWRIGTIHGTPPSDPGSTQLPHQQFELPAGSTLATRGTALRACGREWRGMAARGLSSSQTMGEANSEEETNKACYQRRHEKIPRQRPTLPHRYQCSTIGAGGLNFQVRYGTGCFPSASVT